MKAKKTIYLMVGLVLVLLVGSSAIYADSAFNKNDIASKFNEMKTDLANVKNSDAIVAQVDDIKIKNKDLVGYKKNIELVASLQGNPTAKAQSQVTDEQIIDVLVTNELLVKQATNFGLTVTADEVDQVIKREREALAQTDDPSNDFVRELMKNRIQITGLTEDEFYQSQEVRDKYAESILIGKLYNKLVEDKKITESQGFDQYQKNLLTSKESSIEINEEVLSAQ